MTKLDAFRLVAELAFASVQASEDPSSHLVSVYDALAVLAEQLGLLDEADAARKAANTLRAADEASIAAKTEQLLFKKILGLDGVTPPL